MDINIFVVSSRLYANKYDKKELKQICLFEYMQLLLV